MLGRAGNAGIVHQVASCLLTVKQSSRQRPDGYILFKAPVAGKHLDAANHATILVLPSAAGGQQLLQGKSAATYLDLAPVQRTEV